MGAGALHGPHFRPTTQYTAVSHVELRLERSHLGEGTKPSTATYSQSDILIQTKFDGPAKISLPYLHDSKLTLTVFVSRCSGV